LEDLPTGHPIITSEALEEIGEYAFTTLRGLTLVGGQVRIDESLLPDRNNSGTDSMGKCVILINTVVHAL
jgi:hypothetical protein